MLNDEVDHILLPTAARWLCAWLSRLYSIHKLSQRLRRCSNNKCAKVVGSIPVKELVGIRLGVWIEVVKIGA